MVVARAVWQFTPSHSVWHIKAWNLSAIFVTLDIVLVQHNCNQQRHDVANGHDV